jgi:hypothetical protein
MSNSNMREHFSGPATKLGVFLVACRVEVYWLAVSQAVLFFSIG